MTVRELRRMEANLRRRVAAGVSCFRRTAPSPDPHLPRPTSEEWAAWADANLPAEDAKFFHPPDSRRSW